MKSTADIERLLDRLDACIADELEGQDLDFKEWDESSLNKAVKTVVETAVCMVNGGGGSVVFGVADRIVGRAKSIRGVPLDTDVNKLKKAVYDSTDPRIMPVFDEIRVAEGSGRVLIMHVHPGLPPHTDTKGRGTIRVGKECRPLTGTQRHKLAEESGDADYTRQLIPETLENVISPSAMEQLRKVAGKERAPDEMLALNDRELLSNLGLLTRKRSTRAAILVAGSDDALREHCPSYNWTHLRMKSETDYSDRTDGNEALPIALDRLLDKILADNPIQTVRDGLFHFEHRTYPEIAIREALLNAFCHADHRLGSPIIVKQFPTRIEIANPGGLVGGITPDNILHHTPITRNPCLVEALVRLRLVNRSNLGVARMYRALLVEGKEPPSIEDLGDAVRVTFRASDLSVPFRSFVEEENQKNRDLSVDALLIIQHLLRHAEIDTATAGHICQRSEEGVREVLSTMERRYGYLERGGTGRGTYWSLRADLHKRLAGPGYPERDQRIDWEAAKTRILSILTRRAENDEQGLSNSEIRQITRLDRRQVVRLLTELREDGQVTVIGKKKGARWVFVGPSSEGPK